MLDRIHDDPKDLKDSLVSRKKKNNGEKSPENSSLNNSHSVYDKIKLIPSNPYYSMTKVPDSTDILYAVPNFQPTGDENKKKEHSLDKNLSNEEKGVYLMKWIMKLI